MMPEKNFGKSIALAPVQTESYFASVCWISIPGTSIRRKRTYVTRLIVDPKHAGLGLFAI